MVARGADASGSNMHAGWHPWKTVFPIIRTPDGVPERAGKRQTSMMTIPGLAHLQCAIRGWHPFQGCGFAAPFALLACAPLATICDASGVVRAASLEQGAKRGLGPLPLEPLFTPQHELAALGLDGHPRADCEPQLLQPPPSQAERRNRLHRAPTPHRPPQRNPADPAYAAA